MQQRREQLLEELRRAEQARDLLRELEHNLSEEKGPDFAGPREATGAAGTIIAGGSHRAAGD